MIECPDCQAKHPESSLFCDQCGAYLLEANWKETDPRFRAVGWMEREEPDVVAGEDITHPLGIRLTIPDSGRDLEVSLTKEVHIGRLDAVSGSFPDVDLTSNGGLEHGVSRHHAKITRRGSEVLIEDLGSINGTFLNGRKLIPYVAEVLKSGDELQLGDLLLRVSFTA